MGSIFKDAEEAKRKLEQAMSNYKNDHTTNKCVWENDTCNIGEECNKCLGEWFN